MRAAFMESCGQEDLRRAYSADMSERDAAGGWSSPSLPIGGNGGTGEGEDGVDLSLIRWFLGLSPAERLRVLQNTVDAISKLRERRAAD
jgi:hypothetical protein